ncbi:MAG: carboxypeptidase regulatory-like domain-containing protein [Acidobacteria bacterium]|nr:MAG: carboxypeptidase regulatory-like domain-containing protein [Acidobacteriota bacterium]
MSTCLRYVCLHLAVAFLLLLNPASGMAQTATTGMIQGTVKDPTGAYITGATLRLTQVGTNIVRTTQSDDAGRYSFPLLPPGRYDLEVSKSGFTTIKQTGIPVRINEKTTLDLTMEPAPVEEVITVEAEPEIIQVGVTTLGRVVEERQVVNLPLATRNFTQILALSPGVIANVANAGALGRNSLEISANGGRLSDNNVQMNGADANNVFVTNIGDGNGSQGVAVPAPDTIQEFKVQTALYDASTGRNGGANVNVVTKSGTNEFHGNVYHFFRNEALNANEFFRNRAGLEKPRLRQNQFGFTFGGPIRKDRAFFFGSYEGNRQSNGVTGGATSVAFIPPLTDDRSPQALGRLFGGQTGRFGGVAVAPDGSNINPVALAILNMRLPNGEYLIPTPQIILPSGIGQSNFSIPAEFDENQFNLNFDIHLGSNDVLSEKYFFADTDSMVPFGSGANVPGFPSTNDGRNHNFTLTWTHIFSPTFLHEARVGFTRLADLGTSEEPIRAADVGIKTPVTVSGLPNIGFLTFGLAFGAALPPLGSFINNYQFADSITYVRGQHRIRAGFEFKRIQSNVRFDFDQRAILRFFTFPDFLLGLPFPDNQARAPFSHVFVSSARAGLIGRAQRMNDIAAYVQDDIALHPQFQLNLGIRYELYGQVSGALGRLSNFEPARALAEPPPEGTFSGFVIARNTIGNEPPEVLRLDSDTIIENDLNNWGPRFGFTYRPFAQMELLIRGGYGAYFSRPGTVTLFQTGPNLPFAVISTRVGVPNNTASLQDPFDPTLPRPEDFPIYIPRVVGSNIFVNAMDPKMRAPTVHQWSLNVQLGFARDYLLEVGYVGTRGTGLIGRYRFNQPLLASPTNPVHGQTTNTIANAALRVPIQGINPTNSQLHTNGFDSIYHSLQASLTKRFSRGLVFLASYTWGHSIDNLSIGDLLAVGGFQGDVRNLDLNRGSSDTDRRHRFVFNFYWELPWSYTGRRGWAKLLNGWAFSGIATFQSGLPFSIIDTSAATIFATTTSRAQLKPGMTLEDIELEGSVHRRLNRFFNTDAFTAAPPIGDGTGFGNSGRNILRGPDQRVVDLAIIKRTSIGWPTEVSNVEFRTEFFNAFNTVNFGQPGNNFASPATFGVINNTTVAPRIIQFALKFNF